MAAEVWLDKFHIGRIYSKSVFVSLVSILGDVSNMRIRQDMFSVCRTLLQFGTRAMEIRLTRRRAACAKLLQDFCTRLAQLEADELLRRRSISSCL